MKPGYSREKKQKALDESDPADNMGPCPDAGNEFRSAAFLSMAHLHARQKNEPPYRRRRAQNEMVSISVRIDPHRN